MTGQHRRTGGTPGRVALVTAVSLVGGTGLVTGLLADAAPEPDRGEPTAAPATTTPGDADRAVPGLGERAIDAVGGARQAAVARESAARASAVHVGTVAAELRREAATREAQARVAGDLELAEYHRQQAAQEDRVARASEPARPAGEPAGSSAHAGASSESSEPTGGMDDCSGTGDPLDPEPFAVPGPGCDLDAWVADQISEEWAGGQFAGSDD